MDLISTIASIGVAQGIFLGVNLLFSVRKKALSPLFFGLLLLLLSLHNLDSIFTYTRIFYKYPHFFGVKDPLVLLYGPLVFFYVRSVINASFRLRWVDLLHLLPFVLFLIRITPLYFKSMAYKIRLLDAMYANYTHVRDMEINLLFNAHIFIYLMLSILMLIGYVIRQKRAIGRHLKEMKLLLVILIAVSIIFSVNLFRFFTDYTAETILWIPLMISFGLFIIGYRSLSLKKTLVLDASVMKSTGKLSDIIEALDQLMIKERLFLETKLSIQSVAARLETNRQYLSEALNVVKGKSFNSYVNELRVIEAKQMLISKEYAHFSLEKISEDAGFNSFSSFQRSFKKIVGQSPSRFRNEGQLTK